MKLNVSFRSLSVFTIGIFFSFSVFATQTKFNRAIVFGDSLSDVGTYSPAALFKGGGKFTTNPGKIWAEIVADNLELPMKENRHEGYGIPFKLIGGFNYAQGGARIVGAAAVSVEPTKFSARSLTEQVGFFLTEYKTCTESDLVFIQGGANDIFAQQQSVSLGMISSAKGIANVEKAADDLVVLIMHLKASSCNSIAVQNLPMIEKSPRVLGYSLSKQTLIAQMVQAFNFRLTAKILATDVLLMDLYSFDQNFNLVYQQYGFTTIDRPACKVDQVVGGLSLFCSTKSLVQPDAAVKFKFADDIHPTTGFSKLVGNYSWGLVRDRFELE